MNEVDEAGIIYLSKRGVDKGKVARAFGATKREVEEMVRKAKKRKGVWRNGNVGRIH